MKNIAEMTVVEIKAVLYDEFQKISVGQQNVKVLEQALNGKLEELKTKPVAKPVAKEPKKK